MFDLAFIAEEPTYVDDEGWRGLWALTVLGDFRERFVAPIGWWTRADYERQWLAGACRLLNGASESAFTVEAGRLWWTAWRVDTRVFVQQQLLVDEAMAVAWTADADHIPYALVGPRRTHTEDDRSVSEWCVSLDDLRAFTKRREFVASRG